MSVSLKDLFSVNICEVFDIPEKPCVFWYPSSGIDDYRANLFLTDYVIENQKLNHNRILLKPDLFLYNCLYFDEIMTNFKLSVQKNNILYKDSNTIITATKFVQLALNPNTIVFSVDFNNIDDNASIPPKGKEAFYFEIEVTINLNSAPIKEVQKILFFETENIDFFNKVISQDYFQVEYFSASYQGLNCKKDILNHIYKENISIVSNRKFMPKYIVVDLTENIESIVNECEGIEISIPEFWNFPSRYINGISTGELTNKVYQISY